MRTIKLVPPTSKKVKEVGKRIDAVLEQKNVLETERESYLAEFKDQFKKVFIGNFFYICDTSRDGETHTYIIPKKVSDPYLINKDKDISCGLTCDMLRISVSSFDGEITKQVVYAQNEYYSAHTPMKLITKEEYRSARRDAISIFNTGIK